MFKFLFLAFSLCLSQASANPLQLKDPVVGSFVEYKVGKSKYRRQVLSKMESEKLWFNHYRRDYEDEPLRTDVTDLNGNLIHVSHATGVELSYQPHDCSRVLGRCEFQFQACMGSHFHRVRETHSVSDGYVSYVYNGTTIGPQSRVRSEQFKTDHHGQIIWQEKVLQSKVEPNMRATRTGRPRKHDPDQLGPLKLNTQRLLGNVSFHYRDLGNRKVVYEFIRSDDGQLSLRVGISEANRKRLTTHETEIDEFGNFLAITSHGDPTEKYTPHRCNRTFGRCSNSREIDHGRKSNPRLAKFETLTSIEENIYKQEIFSESSPKLGPPIATHLIAIDQDGILTKFTRVHPSGTIAGYEIVSERRELDVTPMLPTLAERDPPHQ